MTQRNEKGTILIALENDFIRVEVAPEIGGKITSIFNKTLCYEFLWSNPGIGLEKKPPGTDYDENFWGGIDELLPNDIPESIDGISYPDHGELWTTALNYQTSKDEIHMSGLLPLSSLHYQKNVRLHESRPEIELSYRIKNTSDQTRHFLWKLHAALNIREGDQLKSDAKIARIVSPDSSRFAREAPFQWPTIEGNDASMVPSKDGTMDFFYLYDINQGYMAMISEAAQRLFAYHYDPSVFPYQWYFASYGKFFNHYTSILEPATAMPVSVNEAAQLGQCSVLKPGEEIATRVTIYAGTASEKQPN